jgi:DNA-binding transcriptional ArsR family regulator
MENDKKLSAKTIEMIAARFKILSDPMRLQILHELHEGERNVMQIVGAADTSQPNVSKHLRILQDAGLVLRRQEGNSAYFRIADESIFEMCEAVCNSLKIQAENKMASLAGI